MGKKRAMASCNSSKLNRLGLWIILPLVLLSQRGHCYSGYLASVPNAENVYLNGEHYVALGHNTASGTPTNGLNSFGNAFMLSHSWTVELCQADSDGDGQSNGLELGDPDCVWTPGDTPSRTTDISHPAVASSTTSAEGGGSGGNTTSSTWASTASTLKTTLAPTDRLDYVTQWICYDEDCTLCEKPTALKRTTCRGSGTTNLHMLFDKCTNKDTEIHVWYFNSSECADSKMVGTRVRELDECIMYSGYPERYSKWTCGNTADGDYDAPTGVYTYVSRYYCSDANCSECGEPTYLQGPTCRPTANSDLMSTFEKCTIYDDFLKIHEFNSEDCARGTEVDVNYAYLNDCQATDDPDVYVKWVCGDPNGAAIVPLSIAISVAVSLLFVLM